MITIELTKTQAQYVIDVLIKEQERFSYEFAPDRIFEIREVITDLTDKILQTK